MAKRKKGPKRQPVGRCIKWSKGRKRCLERAPKKPDRRRTLRGVRTRHERLAGTRQGISVEQVRIDRQGYDSRGRYWGVGQKLYRVSTETGDDVYLRASSAQAARTKVQSERAHVRQAQATREWGDRFDGVRGARKGRCKRWSKGRTRCLKRG